jgi:hypothetical protein
MDIITILYIANATLLLLHEIESAYEKEWDILKLPGNITGFLLMHIPIIIVMLFGLIEIEKGTFIGMVLGIVLGIGGIIPFVVHKIIVRRENHFNLLISNVIIYLNILTGIWLLILAAAAIA